MSDDKSISLVNLGELAKPVTLLIEKVSLAIGSVWEPGQIKRIARAKADACLIEAKSEIEITDLHRRAMTRFVEEEASRQTNMEEITKKAMSLLADESNPGNMEDDWVTNFYAKSRIVSNDDMQRIWAQVLAGEANAPGSFSKRTVNLLGDLDKRDAYLFQRLCGFGCVLGEFTLLVFDSQAKIYTDLGINFGSLSHLSSLGLIQFNWVTGFKRQLLPKNFTVSCSGQVLSLTMENEAENTLPVGTVFLTQAGQELAQVVKAPLVDGFYDYLKEQWKVHLSRDENA